MGVSFLGHSSSLSYCADSSVSPLPTTLKPTTSFPPPSKAADSYLPPTLPFQHKAQPGTHYLPPQHHALPCSFSWLKIPPSSSSWQVSTAVPLACSHNCPLLSLQPLVAKLGLLQLPKSLCASHPFLSHFTNLLWAKIASQAISFPVMRLKSLFVHPHLNEFIFPKA